MSEQITDWENTTGSRFYLVTKGPENLILGIFSNRQKLMQALTFSGLEGCYIRGTRKNKEVNDGTIGDEVVYHKRRCDIYCEDEIAYRIGLYGVNHMNPKFIEEAKQRIKSAKVENEKEQDCQRTLFDDFKG